MTSRAELFTNIAIGFAIGAFLVLVAGGPELWRGVSAEALLAFIQ